MDNIEVLDGGEWKALPFEEFKKRFWSRAMVAHALSILHRDGYLRAGAWEYRRAVR